MKKLMAIVVLCGSLSASAAKVLIPRVTVFVDSRDDFSTFIAAAFQKKGTPAIVVLDRGKAQYVLQSSAVQTHNESGEGILARCAFALCAGVNATSTVAVELIEPRSSVVRWSYMVHKQRGANYNEQSMAEAIAKHLKAYLEGKGQ